MTPTPPPRWYRESGAILLDPDLPDLAADLSARAFRLWTNALLWTNSRDGGDLLPKLALADPLLIRSAPSAGELIACGWWVDEGCHYRMLGRVPEQTPTPVPPPDGGTAP